jgi:peptidoglycan/LPS O-acetylase OafA/YrhL
VWTNTWPLVALAALLAFALSSAGRSWSERLSWLPALFALALLGGVTGALAGFSRSPALGTVLPAVLSLVGGMFVYLIGKHQTERLLVSLAVIALALSLWVGANWGAILRDVTERYLTSAAFLKDRAYEEWQVRKFREALRLPPDPPELHRVKD